MFYFQKNKIDNPVYHQISSHKDIQLTSTTKLTKPTCFSKLKIFNLRGLVYLRSKLNLNQIDLSHYFRKEVHDTINLHELLILHGSPKKSPNPKTIHLRELRVLRGSQK